jgi:hypothetical protein
VCVCVCVCVCLYVSRLIRDRLTSEVTEVSNDLSNSYSLKAQVLPHSRFALILSLMITYAFFLLLSRIKKPFSYHNHA